VRLRKRAENYRIRNLLENPVLIQAVMPRKHHGLLSMRKPKKYGTWCFLGGSATNSSRILEQIPKKGIMGVILA